MKGSVTKKGRRWYVVIEDRAPTGERKRRWHSGFATKREAEAARIELLSRQQRGEYIEPSRLTVGQYLTDEWLPAIQSTIRPTTMRSYELHVARHIAPYIGSVILQHLTAGRVNELYSTLLSRGRSDGRGGLSCAIVRRVHAVVHRALRDAVKWNRLPRNPADTADPPKVVRKELKTWRADQVRRFLDFVRSDRLVAAWTFACTTGARRGEVLGLRWSDLDLDSARASIQQTLVAVGYELHFSTPKTERGRRLIALDDTTVARLRRLRKQQAEEQLLAGPVWQDHGLVFCHEDGSPIHPDQFSKQFRKYGKAAGLPPIRLHDLRHSWATLALQAGLHPKVVSERLGHATVALTLDTYTHAIPALQEEAAETVAALVFGDSVEVR